MVEDSRFSRKKKKVAGVDDPIVIVQRILNVFRQLHILDDKQKQDFNDLILQQPPEIRHMCSVLPGGSLLQEYVDELEESRGIAPDQIINGASLSTEGKENILARALADEEERKIQLSPPKKEENDISAISASNNNIGNEATLELQKQMLELMKELKTSAPTVAAPVSAALSMDGNFGKEIATAISSALAASDQARREETKELVQSLTSSQMKMTQQLVTEIANNNQIISAPVPTSSPIIAESGGVKIIDNTAEITRAITESQLQMAKMFLQQNAVSASNSSSNNANNIQINTAPVAAGSHELVADIIRAQGEMFREMSKEQTKELSLLISGALKESNQLSNKTLTEALGAFHKENLHFWEKQEKNSSQRQYVMASAPTMGGSAAYQIPENDQEVIYEYEEEQEETTPVTGASSYIQKVFGTVFNRAHTKEDNIPADEGEDFNLQTIEEEAVDVPEMATPSEYFSDTSLGITGDGLGLSAIEPPTKKKKRKKKKNKNRLNADGFSFAENDITINVEDASENEEYDEGDIFEEEAEDTKLREDASFSLPREFKLDTSLFDLDLDNDTVPEVSIEPQNAPSVTESLPKLDLSLLNKEADFHTLKELPIQEPETVVEEEYVWEELLPEEEEPTLAEETIPAQIAVAFEETEQLFDEPIAMDDNFEEVQSLNLEAEYAPIEMAPSTASTEEDAQWKWEYEEETSPDSQDVVAQAPVSVEAEEDGEWEWEYEEDSGSDNQAVIAQPQAETSAEEYGEWEWEYEEDSGSDNQAVIAQPQAETSAEEDGEWEWEYEEDSGSDNQAVIAQPQTENSAEEDGEWEWEYEETEETIDEGEIEVAPQEEMVETADALVKEFIEKEEPLLSEFSKDTDVDFSDLFSDFVGEEKSTPMDENFLGLDPYSGNNSPQMPEDLGLNSLQSGSLYFQKDITKPQATAKEDKPVIPSLGDEDLLPDFGEEDTSNEPYKLNSDIKP